MSSISFRQVRKSRRALRAFTAIEVLLAMTVLLISSAGVVSMQKASIQGNADARHLDVANSIARTWLDRLQADGTSWNSVNGLTFTNWLGPALAAGTFIAPATTAGKQIWSPSADILGRDLTTPNNAATIFCTHVYVTPVTDYALPGGNTPTPVILQATVLVYWSKNLLGAQGTPAAAADMCGVKDVAAAEAAAPGTYHMIFATESIRRSS